MLSTFLFCKFVTCVTDSRVSSPYAGVVLAAVSTFALSGIDALHVVVEVDIHTGLPAFNIVGLPDAAVRESRERVRAALRNSGFEFPLRRITVNLAPADLHKVGPSFDLAVAAGLLVASGQLPSQDICGLAVFGELALDGSLRPVRGALSLVVGAKQTGIKRVLLPIGNLAEASLVEGVESLSVRHLSELGRLAEGLPVARPEPLSPGPDVGEPQLDLADVQGHAYAKHALEIAAAGGHNLLMQGPPGCGKTMLARRLPGILPPLSSNEVIEVTRVYSVAAALEARPFIRARPFRAPHHSVSLAGLVGGGSSPRPGEISLAHHGVLFLDELAEFPRIVLEALRQPLESGSITVTRARSTTTFPARFTLVAATNPCPCGFAGDRQRICSCSPAGLARYQARLSGPLLDRIDVVFSIERPVLQELTSKTKSESSISIRQRVLAARLRQSERFGTSGTCCNAGMDIRMVRKFCPLSRAASEALLAAERKAIIGGRGYIRTLRVARTVADLAGHDVIEVSDITLALGLRQIDIGQLAA